MPWIRNLFDFLPFFMSSPIKKKMQLRGMPNREIVVSFYHRDCPRLLSFFLLTVFFFVFPMLFPRVVDFCEKSIQKFMKLPSRGDMEISLTFKRFIFFFFAQLMSWSMSYPDLSWYFRKKRKWLRVDEIRFRVKKVFWGIRVKIMRKSFI